MKAASSIFAIALTLSLTLPAFASNEKPEEGHGAAAAEHRDNEALFPPKKADPAKATPPGKVTLVSPKFEEQVSGDSVTLKWQEVATANMYHLQVATDPNFKWLKVDDHAVKGTSFDVKGLEAGKLYFWRVAGWKNDNMAATNHGFFTASSFEVK